jgi:anti-sigma factor RsiW
VSPVPIRDEELSAFLDGELDSARAAALELELARDAALAEQVRDLRKQRELLHNRFDPVLQEPPPARLLRRRAMSPWLRACAAALLLAIGGMLGWWLRGTQEPVPPVAIVHNAAVAHAAYTPEVRHPVEVTAKEEAHLVAWLSKRLGAQVRAPQLGELGYELLGGRLLPEPGRPGAQFMYQDASGKRLTLYVSTDVANRDTAFRYASEGGLHVFYWIDRQLGYALSGDLDKNEMLRIARAVYERLNP